MGVLDWVCLIRDRNSWKVSLSMVVIDVGEEKSEEPMTSQLIKTESNLSLLSVVHL